MNSFSILMVFVIGLSIGGLIERYFGIWTFDWQCTASHREGPEHDQHDVCDQYSRKEK